MTVGPFVWGEEVFPPLLPFADFKTSPGPLRLRMRDLRRSSWNSVKIGRACTSGYFLDSGDFEGVYQDVVKLEAEVVRLTLELAALHTPVESAPPEQEEKA